MTCLIATAAWRTHTHTLTWTAVSKLVIFFFLWQCQSIDALRKRQLQSTSENLVNQTLTNVGKHPLHVVTLLQSTLIRLTITHHHNVLMFSLELTMESSLFWRTGLADLAVKETTLTLGLSLYIYQ